MSIEWWCGTFYYNENVTAGDPQYRMGNLGGVPRYTLDGS